jgi:DNA-directed RNA polymerase subunit RPC12/RpoP
MTEMRLLVSSCPDCKHAWYETDLVRRDKISCPKCSHETIAKLRAQLSELTSGQKGLS